MNCFFSQNLPIPAVSGWMLVVLFSLSRLSGNCQPLEYTVSPLVSDEIMQLKVTVQFDGTHTGKSYLNYQSNQFGVDGQMDFISFPEQMPGVSIFKEPDSNRFVVIHAPDTRVHATYLLTDLQGKMPFYNYCCFNPIIKPTYFHVQAGHLLATPSHYWDGPDDIQTVRFYMKNFPPEWVLHSSFGKGPKQHVALRNTQLGYAIFVGGDFRRYDFKVANQPVYFVTRGEWTQFTDDTLRNLLQKTVEGHRVFWQDFSDTLYSVTFLPIDDAPWSDKAKSASCGGSGLTNSFMSFATNNPGIDYDYIRYVYVHELMHRWIGIKIENANEEKQYWFSEGFTEYFTLKNSLRYGFIDVNKFLQQLNDDFMAEHYSSTTKHFPNDSLNYERFWNGGRDWEKLPYRRGCIYAFHLDNYIRKKSKGAQNLDMMMRQILKVVQANPNQKLDHTFFTKMVRQSAGKKGVLDFQKFIEKGIPIDFKNTPLPQGIALEIVDMPKINKYQPPGKTKPEIVKNIPQFRRDPKISENAIKAALIQ